MNELEAVEAELAATKAQLDPLIERRMVLFRRRDKLRSVAFIQANDITLDEVERSDGPGKPFFQTLLAFRDWMRKNVTNRRWFEWNGTIYSTAELLADRVDWNSPGRIEDVLEAHRQ